MQLSELQTQFLMAVRGKNYSAELLATIETETQFSATERLLLYRNTSLTAHINALSETFSICKQILGKNYFRAMSSIYISEYPSSNQDLNQYGAEFPGWLEVFSQEHEELAEYMYLPDLAKLEWCWQLAFYNEEAKQFNFSEFSQIDEKSQAKLVFEIDPTLFLLTSEYPIYEIWLRHKSKQDISELRGCLETQHICIYREDLRIKIELLDKPTFNLLKKIKQQICLGELHVSAEKYNWDINTLLPLLIKRKFICGFYTKK
jgi:putative DNA-binding protein